MDRKVFRLQQIPLHLDRLDVVKLLQNALGIEASVRIHSLAQSVNVWAPSQTATLMFDSAPPELEQRLAEGDEWTLPAANLKQSLMLDTHFRGLTALNDPADHAADCIAISGLGSHPVYSWQPRAGDRKFMWIRDRLPRDLPSVRYILYGYDSKVGSNSFQSIRDLAISLIEQLKAQGWTLSSCKPLLFLAHSLGGLILKEVLVVLANHTSRSPLKEAIRGAIFFGVPNLGMEQSALLAMVDGTPNQALIEDLAPDSHYLVQLHEKMTGLAYLQGLDCHWAYETRTSPTVQVREIQQDGSAVWSRSGPEVILVTAQSATGGLYKPNEPPPSSIFPINQDHSNMVKFSENDATCAMVLEKLKSLLQPRELRDRSLKLPSFTPTEKPEPEARQSREVGDDDLIDSLAPPELQFRLDNIEESFENTFDWLFETPEPGFTQWLRDGTGLFWIRGKPGSGKSTLMKFISLDGRTNEYMLNWKSDYPRHHASFFFHHRGTPLQKSFEGLLRSLLAQILSQERRLGPILRSRMYIGLPSDASLLRPDFWTLSMVQAWFQYVLEQDKVPLHLTLFLDALDEYDGSKEFICDFLNQISQIPSTSTKNVRVCFSSRPWNIFITSFKTCAAGFQLQDFTEDDIRDYCLGSIRNHVTDDVDKLKEIIPELVRRARGVFLWVKLVVKDLAAGLQSNLQLDDLQQLLSSLPTELNEFYMGIIQRIPKAHRWATYMLLEMVIRGIHPLTLDNLVLNMNRLHQTPSLEEGLGANLEQTQGYHSPMENKNEFVATYGGGLVEIVKPINGPLRVQLLHQTVEDFITDPAFPECVLGNRARITAENGHSFWAKSHLLKLAPNADAMSTYLKDTYRFGHAEVHALLAERTTGQSLRSFIRSRILVNQMPRCPFEIKFVTQAYLRRYMAELLAEDPNLIRDSKLPLISWLNIEQFRYISDPFHSAVEFILGQGYRIQNDVGCLFNVIYATPYNRSPAISLMERGANVNQHDPYSGLSPLDMTCRRLVLGDQVYLIEEYPVLTELIRRGAKRRKTDLTMFRRVISAVRDCGLPTTDLEAELPSSRLHTLELRRRMRVFAGPVVDQKKRQGL